MGGEWGGGVHFNHSSFISKLVKSLHGTGQDPHIDNLTVLNDLSLPNLCFRFDVSPSSFKNRIENYIVRAGYILVGRCSR